MTVTNERRRDRLVARITKDFEPGSYVRERGERRIGRIESVSEEDGHAWVVWKDGRKERLPLAALRSAVRAGSHKFDSRWPG